MKTETRRVSPSMLKKDEFVYDVLPAIEGYSHPKEEYSTDAVTALYMDLKAKQRIETQKQGELKAARDIAVAAEHVFHNAILEVKNQVRAQFGEDSNELQSIGMKKKSERKAAKRNPKK